MARIVPMNVLDPSVFDDERQRQVLSRTQGYIPNAPSAPSMRDVAEGTGLALNVLHPIANAVASHVGESNRLQAEQAARAAFEAKQNAPAMLAQRTAQAEQMRDVEPMNVQQDAGRYGIATELPAQAPQQVMAAPVAPLAPVAPVSTSQTPLGEQPVFPALPERRRVETAQDAAAMLAPKAAAADVPQFGGEMDSAREQTPQPQLQPRAAPAAAPKFQDLDELRIRAFLAGQSNDVNEKRAVLMALKDLGEAGYSPHSIGEAFNPHEAKQRVVQEFQGLLSPTRGKVRDPVLDALRAQQIAASQIRGVATQSDQERKAALFEDTKNKLHAQAGTQGYKEQLARLDSIARAPGGDIAMKQKAQAAKAQIDAQYAERIAQSLLAVRESQGDAFDSQAALNDMRVSGEIPAHIAQMVSQAMLNRARVQWGPQGVPGRETPSQKRGADLNVKDYESAREEAETAAKAVQDLTTKKALADRGALEPQDFQELIQTMPDLGKAINAADASRKAKVLSDGLGVAISQRAKEAKRLKDEAERLRKAAATAPTNVTEPPPP